MFRVEVDNKMYGVRFQYHPVALIGEPNDLHFDEISVEDERKFVGDPSLRTICQILELDDSKRTHEVIAEGSATCDHRDRFDKNTGRWMAFEVAVDTMHITFGSTKEERKQFYHAYFRNHKHKRHVLDRIK